MSWAEEDWTVGLSGRVLQKVKELQVLKDRLSRENKQKQLQLDNTHTSLEKQTAKVNTDVLMYNFFLLKDSFSSPLSLQACLV
uniref:Centromere protein Cenp-F N-terminal domain-containing protein n=1 Tax=Cyprinodon variegatus TaxID=28743 RepID=A0A3Q2DUC9_CYPVA